jgi:predicted permease
VFLVGEVALALILVVAAGVTSRALAGLLRLDGGFDGRPVLTFRLSIPESRRRAPDEVRTFLDRLLTELRALPSVEEVSTSTLLPIDGPWETSFRSDTQPKLPPDKVQFAAFGYASPGYAKALGLRLVAGRWFEPTDDLSRPEVVVIDDELARDFYPGGSAVGRRLLSNDGKQVREIIGVVHHVAAYGLAGPEPARHQFYMAIAQMKDAEGPRAPRSVNVAVRTRGRPELMAAPVVRTVSALDPELPVYEVRTMEQLMGESLDAQRFATVQLSLFALLALVLAVVGLYAVLSYTVAQRTKEIGIRMALGASPAVVLRSVVGRGLAWAGIGLAIGTAGALLTNRLLVGIVYGVRPADPWVFLVTLLGLFAFAALASWIPARRAVSVDAAISLRAE